MSQNTNSIIYSFYEPGVEIFEKTQRTLETESVLEIASNQIRLDSSLELVKAKNRKFSYKCKVCSKQIKCQINVNSNLSTHLNSRAHEVQKKEYDDWVAKNKGKKQSILTVNFVKESKEKSSVSESNGTSNLISIGAVTRSEKYKQGSIL